VRGVESEQARVGSDADSALEVAARFGSVARIEMNQSTQHQRLGLATAAVDDSIGVLERRGTVAARSQCGGEGDLGGIVLRIELEGVA